MTADQSDPKYVTPTKIGELTDVSSAGTPATGDTMVWDNTDKEYKRVASAAAIANVTGGSTVDAEARAALNLLLAAARTHGVILS